MPAWIPIRRIGGYRGVIWRAVLRGTAGRVGNFGEQRHDAILESFHEWSLRPRHKITHRRNSGSEFVGGRRTTGLRLPAMKRGMTLFDCDKRAATGGTDFSASAQRSLNRRTVFPSFGHSCGKKNPVVSR